MNDFDYDVMQKKAVAASAKRRVNGSKRKRCTMPSDYMTPAEVRRLSGAVTTWNLNEPMTWNEFKKMPGDLQEKYLEGIYSRFGAGCFSVGRNLFRLSGTALGQYMKRNGRKIPTAGRMSKAEMDVFEAWIERGSAQEEEPVCVKEEPVCVSDCDEQESACETVVDETVELGVDSVNFDLTGEITINSFLKILGGVQLPKGVCKVHFAVQQVERKTHELQG